MKSKTNKLKNPNKVEKFQNKTKITQKTGFSFVLANYYWEWSLPMLISTDTPLEDTYSPFLSIVSWIYGRV